LQGFDNADAPAWATTLRCAEAWGVPPWVVERAPGSARWVRRLGVLRELEQAVKEE
jgi:hypothetical protein